MTRTPQLTVVIPVYNGARWLRECLDSVSDQSMTDWEAVVVDDGSTDDSPAILDAHAQRDSRFRIVRQSNAGVSSARNQGLAMASTGLIAFFDGDDVMYPESLEKRYDLIRSSGAELVYAGHEFIDESSNVTGLSADSDLQSDPLEVLYRSPGLAIQTVLAQKSAIDKVGGFDTSLTHGEDWDLWIRLARAGCVFRYAAFVANGYRVHDVSATANRQAMRRGCLRMLDAHRPPRGSSHVKAWQAGRWGIERNYLWSAWSDRRSARSFVTEIAGAVARDPRFVAVLAVEGAHRILRPILHGQSEPSADRSAGDLAISKTA